MNIIILYGASLVFLSSYHLIKILYDLLIYYYEKLFLKIGKFHRQSLCFSLKNFSDTNKETDDKKEEKENLKRLTWKEKVKKVINEIKMTKLLVVPIVISSMFILFLSIRIPIISLMKIFFVRAIRVCGHGSNF